VVDEQVARADPRLAVADRLAGEAGSGPVDEVAGVGLAQGGGEPPGVVADGVAGLEERDDLEDPPRRRVQRTGGPAAGAAGGPGGPAAGGSARRCSTSERSSSVSARW
jgi:hypothetical protein